MPLTWGDAVRHRVFAPRLCTADESSQGTALYVGAPLAFAMTGWLSLSGASFDVTALLLAKLYAATMAAAMASLAWQARAYDRLLEREPSATRGRMVIVCFVACACLFANIVPSLCAAAAAYSFMHVSVRARASRQPHCSDTRCAAPLSARIGRLRACKCSRSCRKPSCCLHCPLRFRRYRPVSDIAAAMRQYHSYSCRQCRRWWPSSGLCCG